jgi:hypothetical protein
MNRRSQPQTRGIGMTSQRTRARMVERLRQRASGTRRYWRR